MPGRQPRRPARRAPPQHPHHLLGRRAHPVLRHDRSRPRGRSRGPVARPRPGRGHLRPGAHAVDAAAGERRDGHERAGPLRRGGLVAAPHPGGRGHRAGRRRRHRTMRCPLVVDDPDDLDARTAHARGRLPGRSVPAERRDGRAPRPGPARRRPHRHPHGLANRCSSRTPSASTSRPSPRRSPGSGPRSAPRATRPTRSTGSGLVGPSRPPRGGGRDGRRSGGRRAAVAVERTTSPRTRARSARPTPWRSSKPPGRPMTPDLVRSSAWRTRSWLWRRGWSSWPPRGVPPPAHTGGVITPARSGGRCGPAADRCVTLRPVHADFAWVVVVANAVGRRVGARRALGGAAAAPVAVARPRSSPSSPSSCRWPRRGARGACSDVEVAQFHTFYGFVAIATVGDHLQLPPAGGDAPVPALRPRRPVPHGPGAPGRSRSRRSPCPERRAGSEVDDRAGERAGDAVDHLHPAHDHLARARRPWRPRPGRSRRRGR